MAKRPKRPRRLVWAPVIDLMEALQRSLAERPEKKAAAQAATSTDPKVVKKKSSSR